MLEIIGGIVVLGVIIFIIWALFSPTSESKNNISKTQNYLKCQICESLIYENQIKISIFSNSYHYKCYDYIVTIISIIKEETLKLEAINLIDKINKEKPTWEQLSVREKEIWGWLIRRCINSSRSIY